MQEINKFFYKVVFFILLTFSVNAENKILNIGNLNAKITVKVFSSLTCPHCASFHNDTLGLIKEEYIDTGKVKFVFRDFPYNYPALLGSMVMRCIPTNIRYDYTNALYLLQKYYFQQLKDQ